MDDTWGKMDLELLLRLKYVDYRGRYGTRLSFYTPLCCFLNFSISRWSPHFVTSFITSQRYKVTVLRLLDCELYCFKLTRDYVITLTNYKGWVTTKVGSTIPINYRGCVISIFRGNEHFPLSNFKGRVHFTRSYYSFTTIGSYNSPRLRNKIRRSTSVISQDYSSWIKLLPETFSLTTSSWMIYGIHFVILPSRVRVELPFENRVVSNSRKKNTS